MKRSSLLTASGAAVTTCVVMILAQPAFAQEADANSGEIIVTAQRRSETLQQVPMTISAFNSDTLKMASANNLESISLLVPSVQMSTTEGKGQIAIRGIGSQFVIGASESPVATHIDGFYIARLSAIVGSFLDIDRVEVLKGPQGTLYGRNATAGAVNIITKKPTHDFTISGSVEGIYIDRGDGTGGGSGLRVSGVVNIPINDRIAWRTAVLKVARDGFYKGYYPNGDKVDLGDADEIYVRSQLSIDLADNINWTIGTDNFWADDRGSFVNMAGQSRPDIQMRGVQLGFENGGRSRRVFLDKPVSNKQRSNAFTSTLSVDLNDQFALKSLTQYRRTKYKLKGEFDSTWADISEMDYKNDSKVFSQEFQLNAELGRLRGVVGLYYFKENAPIDQFFRLENPTALLTLGGRSKTKAMAIFADLTYSFTDQFDVVVGGRYSTEKRGGSQASSFFFGPTPLVVNDADLPWVKYNSFTPKLVFNYRPTEDLTIYASAQKGFKSGGYNIGSLSQNFAYNPEKIKAAEVGLKSRFFNRRAGLNLAAFLYDYTDLQLEDNIVLSTVLRNAARARIKGLELDGFVKPLDGLQIDFSGALLDAKFRGGTLSNPLYSEATDPLNGVQLPLAGKRLPKASKLSGSVSIRYDHELGGGAHLTPQFTASYRSKQYFNAFNDDLVSQKGYWWLRAALNYKPANERWSVTAFVDNITNKFVVTSSQISSSAYGYPQQIGAAPPRTIGLRLDFDL